jgi:cytochrome c oxidase cbb3-type subunit 3
MKFAKYPLLFIALLWGQILLAQADAPAEPSAAASQLNDIMTRILIIIGAGVFIVAMMYMIKVNTFLYRRIVNMEATAKGIALPAPVAVPSGPSFWEKMKKKYWEDAVPVEREQEVMLHHDYDGIRELDNNLPPWWLNMFYATIVFAGIYMYYYHFGGGGPSSAEEYEMQMEEAKQQRAIALAGQANRVDESNVTALTESSALGEGELIYKNSCAACHGQKGEGGIGPNMTDEYWIHGGGIKDIFRTVKYGVPEKGMIAWTQLSPSDMQKVSSYILTLKGTNPPNAKEPQGVIWQDSTATGQ